MAVNGLRFQTATLRDTDSRTVKVGHTRSDTHGQTPTVRHLQTEGCRRLSVIPTFHLPRSMTTLYTNIPITDSSGRKYADRGITLPQLITGAFRKADAGVQFLSALFFLTVCYAQFFTFPYPTATYVKQAALQTEGCRRLSVIPTFHLPRSMTTLYTNIPITDSSG